MPILVPLHAISRPGKHTATLRCSTRSIRKPCNSTSVSMASCVLSTQDLHACRLVVGKRLAQRVDHEVVSLGRPYITAIVTTAEVHIQALGRDLGLFKLLNTRRDSRQKIVTLVFTRQNACEKAGLLRYPWPHQRCWRQRDQSCVQKTRFAVAPRPSPIWERACGTDIY